MFVHDINPVIFSLGPLAIRWYGLFYALGFLITYFFLMDSAKKKRIKNLTEKKVESLILYLLIGVVLGARIFEVFVYHPGYYLSHPLLIPQVWLGGLSFHGGLVGAVLAAYLFSRKNKIHFWDLADLVVIPTAIGLGIGRIANFINGELVGIVTNVPWCVQFQGYEGCRHPVVLYESLKNFFMAGVLYFAYSHRKKLPKGFVFWLFVTMYGLLRFIITFLRDEPRFFGMTLGQYLSAGMFILGIVMLIVFWRRKAS